MNTRGAAAEFRTAQWTKIIEERQASGMNIKNFCIDRGLSRDSYFYWQNKLRQTACKTLKKTGEIKIKSPSGWMQLSCENEPKSSLNIEISGCHITVDGKTDPELLKNICRLLRAL